MIEYLENLILKQADIHVPLGTKRGHNRIRGEMIIHENFFFLNTGSL